MTTFETRIIMNKIEFKSSNFFFFLLMEGVIVFYRYDEQYGV